MSESTVSPSDNKTSFCSILKSTSKRSLCDGCGLPPFESSLSSNGGKPIPLLRCSKCHGAWYHNRKCQQSHYAVHRKVCRSSKNKSCSDQQQQQQQQHQQQQQQQQSHLIGKPPSKQQQQRCYRAVAAAGSKFEVDEARNNKGRGLVSTCFISKGTRIGEFAPLVPPVLNEANRKLRCVVCFRSATSSTDGMEVNSNDDSPVPVILCSNACQMASRDWLQDELRAIHAMQMEYQRKKNENGGGSKQKRNKKMIISPTIILLYRIVRAMSMEQHDKKQQNADRVSDHDSDDDIHVGPVTKVISALQSHLDESSEKEQDFMSSAIRVVRILANIHSASFVMDEQEMMHLASKVLTNGFSIADGESVGIGIGIYGTCSMDKGDTTTTAAAASVASMMNHSCRPNALQTFLYARKDNKSLLPTLLVTACRDITEKEEISVSYIDQTCPTHFRRKQLLEHYKFMCNCQKCETSLRYHNFDEDTLTMGLRCSGCKRGQARRTIMEGDQDGWHCIACGSSDFMEQLAATKSIENDLLEQKSSKTLSLRHCEERYKMIQQYCHPSSWYVRESGEILVQALLDSLSSSPSQDDPDLYQRITCHRALQILEDLLAVVKTLPKNESVVIRWQVLKYKAGKLRLFLNPDPWQAITELQDVHKQLSFYYPPHQHELMIGLEECLRGALC